MLFGNILIFSMIFAFSLLQQVGASTQTICNPVMNSSGGSLILANASCQYSTVTFNQGVSNASISCSGQTLGSNTHIVLHNGSVADRIYNCTINGSTVDMLGRSSLYIIGSNSPVFTPDFENNYSNITIANYLTVRSFQPLWSNSIIVFGNRVAAFSWIFPTMNRTFSSNNTEMQMGEFFNNFTDAFTALKERIPFGAYGINASEFYENESYSNYGKIVGLKTFALPQYTISKSGTVNYNPYEVDYSFIGFDQLVTFTINVTKNMNLTPFYIEPIFPQFNFNILPDNNTRTMTIKYMVAVPPEDSNWNFTAYLYRYDPTEFVMNPTEGIGSHSVLYKAFEFPNATPAEMYNGTYIYYVNYTEPMTLGMNSSIMMIPGNIPGIGTFIEDSTTPSFSWGLGYCAIANSLTVPMSYIKISNSGEYGMVPYLKPLAEPALPQLVDAACGVGAIVNGSDITINCNGGTINDTGAGIIIENSSVVTLNDCNIIGNGIKIINSTGIEINNLTLTPSIANNFGIDIHDAQGVTFNGLRINNGYVSPFSVFSSAGTPFSEAISVNNLFICGSENLSAIKHVAFVYSYTPTCGDTVLYKLSEEISPMEKLAALSIFLILFYAFYIWSRRRKAQEKKLKRKGKGGYR